MSGSDGLDGRILDRVQSGFPVTERPFAVMADEIGIAEADLIERVKALREQGVIRRFGAVFDSRKLGYVSTLVGVKIPRAEDLPAVAAEVSTYLEVTHNYQRTDEYNLWFTLIAASQERIDNIIGRIGSLPQVAEIRNLPALRLYKIKADFRAARGQGGGEW
ncbi:MAG: Lrp/AsnC family transcriptional regulator [Candidatus Glassbacteria bacterium]|nr:Lrp/AsnC family transcriptional regulator [Candidatus Glassbacteria bacterium]